MIGGFLSALLTLSGLTYPGGMNDDLLFPERKIARLNHLVDFSLQLEDIERCPRFISPTGGLIPVAHKGDYAINLLLRTWLALETCKHRNGRSGKYCLPVVVRLRLKGGRLGPEPFDNGVAHGHARFQHKISQHHNFSSYCPSYITDIHDYPEVEFGFVDHEMRVRSGRERKPRAVLPLSLFPGGDGPSRSPSTFFHGDSVRQSSFGKGGVDERNTDRTQRYSNEGGHAHNARPKRGRTLSGQIFVLALLVTGFEAIFGYSIFYAARLFRRDDPKTGLLYLVSGVFGVVGTLLLGFLVIAPLPV